MHLTRTGNNFPVAAVCIDKGNMQAYIATITNEKLRGMVDALSCTNASPSIPQPHKNIQHIIKTIF